MIQKYRIQLIVMIVTAHLFYYGFACSTVHYPRVERQGDEVIQGSFSLILCGGTYLDDPAIVAILDIEGDDYTFEPFTSEYNYLIKENVSADSALKESRAFVAAHADFLRSEVRRIVNGQGRVIGYEVKPLYHMPRFGRQDIIDVRYWFRDRNVRFTVEVKSSVRRMFRNRDFPWN